MVSCFGGGLSESSGGGGGIGVAGIAIVVLVTLKLAGVVPVVGWSWGFVIFVPILAVLAFWVVVFGILGGVLGVAVSGAGISSWLGRRKMDRLMTKVHEEEEKERKEKESE